MFEGLALLLYRAHLGADEVKCGGFDLLHLHTGAIQMPLVVHSLSGGEEGVLRLKPWVRIPSSGVRGREGGTHLLPALQPALEDQLVRRCLGGGN